METNFCHAIVCPDTYTTILEMAKQDQTLEFHTHFVGRMTVGLSINKKFVNLLQSKGLIARNPSVTFEGVETIEGVDNGD